MWLVGMNIRGNKKREVNVQLKEIYDGRGFVMGKNT